VKKIKIRLKQIDPLIKCRINLEISQKNTREKNKMLDGLQQETYQMILGLRIPTIIFNKLVKPLRTKLN
jgi:hypothetical protein